ncbi:hypothetical protein PGQ11_006238 [Apiospora arundinis]|uniref:Heterokaryon incompatibility domain-containing protein n=1 Tax=Apiospora arundinis TaxID=335852 RepID=A0ABR2ISP6_9PEZI
MSFPMHRIPTSLMRRRTRRLPERIDNQATSHLTSGEEYGNAILRHSKRNPNLKHKDWKIPTTRVNHRVPSRARLVKFDEDGQAIIPQTRAEDRDFSLQDLRQSLIDNKFNGAAHGHLYILEGLDPDYVEVVGSELQIDPSFFSRHKRTALWEGRHMGGNTSALPSQQVPSKGFLMEYGELLYFKKDPESFSLRNPNDNRHINVSKKPKISQDLNRVGILHRKTSFWSREAESGKWEAVLLTDPPLPRFSNGKMEVLKGTSKTAMPYEVEIEPYQGGYLDFAEPGFDAETSPPRLSMLDDLWYYFETHGASSKVTCPITATRFAQKIVASNYMILVEYLDACVNELETDIRLKHIGKGQKDQSLAIAMQWEILQSWSHRLPEYCGMVDNILCQRHPDPPEEPQALEDCRKDFVGIKRKMDELRRRAEVLDASFVGLFGMAGMRESLEEAENVRVLTFLGVFFLPLSWISSIFAMPDQYGPEKDRFWLYNAIAFPIAGKRSSTQSDKYWPHRLLHVRQRRSLARENGPIYDQAANPAYATLSYTWGRFQLPGEAALMVHDIPWKIPSIDPAHFTPDQLCRALESITTLSRVEFVWLDVACMEIGHLNDHDPEVSRQRSIFAGADYGFIWLSKTTPDILLRAASFLGEASELISHGLDDDSLAKAAGEVLVKILADPWFSSMWTLIEASVNPYSVLLSAAGTATSNSSGSSPPLSRTVAVEINDGCINLFRSQKLPRATETKPNRPKPLPSGRYLTLWDLLWVADLALGLTSTRAFTPARKVTGALRKSGLSSIVCSNRLYLYHNIWYRKEMRPGDRIVLIKSQIFEAQEKSLKAKGPSNDPLADEVALGTEFAQQDPVLSQLYTRTEREPAASSWVLTRHCHILDLEVYFTCFGPWHAMYKINWHPEESSQLQFTGFVSDLDALAKKWAQPTNPNGNTLIGIACDESEVLKRDGSRARLKHMDALPTRRTIRSSSILKWEVSVPAQLRCLVQISSVLAGEDVCVLLLAYAPGPPRGLAVGAVVVPRSGIGVESSKLWSRIGIVFWLCEEDETASSLAMQGSLPERPFHIDGLPWIKCMGQMV